MIYNFFEIDDMPPMADDIQGYALMIYNFFEIDDIHAYGVIWYGKGGSVTLGI